ncbi:MAG TPA: hypothetical protein VEY09_05535 [Pyrinomonadaceae bacterium]|nr:hypothetical protein [Pyrinomonadaceae bacterium]
MPHRQTAARTPARLSTALSAARPQLAAADSPPAPPPGPLRRVARSLTLLCLLVACSLLLAPQAGAQQRKRRPPPVGSVAVVSDERLAVLRDAPGFAANLLRRLGRGSLVALTGARAEKGGTIFYRVVVTRRTSGWLPAEAFVSPARAGDDGRLLRLARGSEGFDRVARARLLLEVFPRSPLRPAALLLLGDAAESAAERLTREARRRLNPAEMEAGGAPPVSYYLNYNGLDRYRRQGVVYAFDEAAGRFRYDGAAWREILRRHPRSPEATEARNRLGAPASNAP